jgi:iron complex transport system substrate-binding protein
MHKTQSLIATLVTVLTLAACSGGGKAVAFSSDADTLQLRYADNLLLLRHDGWTEARLRNPWDTTRMLHTYLLIPAEAEMPTALPEGTVVRTPLQKAVVYSSVHCGLMLELDALDALGGVCDARYMKQPEVKCRLDAGLTADLGNGMNPDVERMIDLHPDALLLSPFENSGGYGRVEKLGVPIIECADYMETSALGRAEWMRFYGLLFGHEREADSLFQAVENRYLALKTEALKTAKRPTVICDMKNGAVWYVPGGRSTIAGLLRDAGADYCFADDAHSGSLPLPFESVYEKGREADIWLVRYNQPHAKTYAEMATDYGPYTGFRAYQQKQVWGCNTGAVPFYEETPFHPERLLEDFIRIFHPEWNAEEGACRYYEPMK